MLEDFERAAQAVLAAAGPVVVQVGRDGRGSGVVIDAGLVLTNAHNLRGETTTITPAGGTPLEGVAGGVDIEGDLAVVRVEGLEATPLAWRDEPVSPGTPVFALAAGPDGARLSFGLVAAVGRSFRGPRGRRISGSIEHNAPLPRGASGGPVLDSRARLVGLNTHRMGEASYLAVPTDSALRARLDRLAAGESPTRRRLGVVLAPGEVARRLRRSVGLPELDGLLVRGVVEDGPAAAAGLREGDLLTEGAGRPLRSTDDLHDVLDDAGSTLELAVVRGVEPLTVVVQLDPAPPEPAAA
jgi:S1-C subfamily serine protease